MLMGDIMRKIPFKKLLDWIFEELERERSIFGIPESKFYKKSDMSKIEIFGEELETPVGPAAGPHTQLAQNIVASYLCGSRFFELKTVQILDELEIPKPCILAEDECYNTEWSTELTVKGALEEYVKAWFVLHVLQKELFDIEKRGFIFNMSVGYDLKGIKSEKVDEFIESLKDASGSEIFAEYKEILLGELGRFKNLDKDFVANISPQICNSITLSTLHGCPPDEIEAISKYLMSEKKLHTYVKMNPTLLGYEFVQDTFNKMGYDYVQLKRESFEHDLQYDDGIAMLRRLKAFAKEQGKEFGVKLSNTLPVQITKNQLPGEEMYMSGRSLYPLTINLAYKLASEFNGDLRISYSGGADYFNIDKIYETGIGPITVATTLLKPGGYLRIKQLAEKMEFQTKDKFNTIDVDKLKQLAENAIRDKHYLKEKGHHKDKKIGKDLPLVDCDVAPCTAACPIGQDVPEYIRLVGEGRYHEAYELIISKNPLPFITGTICNHRCMDKCTRLDYDEPVLIREIKRLAAEKSSQEVIGKITPKVRNDFARVAVIGAGPSGLAAAYFLAREGMDVTVFDKKEKPGGTVQYVIPRFRISNSAIESDIELIKKMGVKFELGVKEELSIEKLKSQGYDYIYLAIGAGLPGIFHLEADNEEKILNAIEFLENFNKKQDELVLGKRVAVIGGGNTAMDAARAALRVKGVEKVYIIYRRTKEYMPAHKEELEEALSEGVEFMELLSPLSFNNGVLQCQKMELGEPDQSGRRRPVPKDNEREEFRIDTVITATGESVDYDFFRKNGIDVNSDKVLVNPETNETSVENVYVGGDALRGPSTVVEAIADGKKAAEAIIEKENGTGYSTPEIHFDNKRLSEIVDKKGVLKEACKQIDKEPARCLECNYTCKICSEVCPNRANVSVEVDRGNNFANSKQIIHVDGMCNECGNCATFCPYNGAPYKDKLTLFWNHEDFDNSSNNGFLLLEDGSEPLFKFRINGRVIETRLNDGKQNVDIPPEILELTWSVYKKYRYLFLK